MNQYLSSDLQEIERLRAQVIIQEEEIRQLRSSKRQLPPQTTQTSSDLNIPDLFTSTHGGDIPMSAVPVSQTFLPGHLTIPRAVVGVRFPSNRRYCGDGPQAVKRPRTMSQQVPLSHKMDRGASNLSTRSAGPYTDSRPPVPQLPTFQTPSPRAENPGFNNSYMVDGSAIPPEVLEGLGQHIPAEMPPHNFQQAVSLANMASLPTSTGPLVDPAVWLAKHTDLSADLGLFPLSSAHQTELDVSNINIAPSICGSLTSGPTYDNTAPMTRQNSQMIHAASHMSHGQDAYNSDVSRQNIEYGDASPFTNKQSFREDALLAVGSSMAPCPAWPYPVRTSSEGLLLPSDMERSLSSTSNASTKSTSSCLSARAKDALKQQNHRALNAPLKPKPSVEENKSKTGPVPDEKADGKAAISKAKYVRPRQPKVYCNLCAEHKDGFRGEHELRRHKDAKHQALVKKFICVDPVELGLPANVQAVNPLSKCKACKGKKKYGAYYNAAAHLRRTHFKKKPSRSKNKGAAGAGTGAGLSEEEKRGGKGGGDWPSMPELKNWMKEVYVCRDEQLSRDDNEDAEDEVEVEFENTQPFYHAEPEEAPAMLSDNAAAFSCSGDFMPGVHYNFAAPMPVNADMSYMEPMPLSSADFGFTHTNNPLNIELAFDAWD
ncbi:hypothetical protein F5Y17DRAFT_455351 [Xylariaceae sp. FL0594]|nr:hypothetical protein F5Y17DRAFT_455351 [Xylariaceae sp. FL0594]